MFAVIKVAGHQYKVAPGDQLVVQHVDGAAGDALAFPALLVAEGTDVKFGKEAAAVSVSAKLVGHDKGEKIHIRRFRAKSKSRRHVGFRASLTTITIEAIGDTKKVAAPEATPTKPVTAKAKATKATPKKSA